jgi:hypothetical protein
MEIHPFKSVKLFCAVLYNDKINPDDFIFLLSKVFSPADHKSPVFLFEHTDYYTEEMGANLHRILLSFEKLIRPESLAEIKHLTRIMENAFRIDGKRMINLDPGYLDYDKVVLASAKYGRQKIALENGIYADPTLEFTNHQFCPYPWTFPDFSTNLYYNDLQIIRHIYKHQLRIRP